MEGRRKVKRKSKDWSFKENSPGQRYQAILDINGRIRALFGGYSPKVYDSDWLITNKDYFKTNMAGAVIICDNHFATAAKKVKELTLVTPLREIKKRNRRNGRRLSCLTKAELAKNKDIKGTRARVEEVFGILKTQWKCLSTYWKESKELQDSLVYLASGVYNYKLK